MRRVTPSCVNSVITLGPDWSLHPSGPAALHLAAPPSLTTRATLAKSKLPAAQSVVSVSQHLLQLATPWLRLSLLRCDGAERSASGQGRDEALPCYISRQVGMFAAAPVQGNTFGIRTSDLIRFCCKMSEISCQCGSRCVLAADITALLYIRGRSLAAQAAQLFSSRLV